MLAALLAAVAPARALETPLASFEPQEVGLQVTRGAQDTGLIVSRVPGGVNGAPPATDGDYVLKLQFVNENGKIEFRMDWSDTTYDLAGHDALLADVFIATSSALPGLMGIWSSNWYPPNAWQPAAGVPGVVGEWTTVTFPLSNRTQTGLNSINAVVFENLAGASGVLYVDHFRFVGPGSGAPAGPAINCFSDRTELTWKAVRDAGLEGYNVYRSDSATGPFEKRNDTLIGVPFFREPREPGAGRRYYRVTSVIAGVESEPSQVVDGVYNGLTDEELLNLVQAATFGYFWNFAHPVSGAAREGYTHWSEIVTTGGTGMGLMAIAVGAERGFVTRAQAAERVRRILRFYDMQTTRYHGAWAHWINGTTGETIPFSQYDDGGDLVETAYFCQGLLTVRQYFDGADPVEADIRTIATRLWEGVEWDWYLRYPGGQVLYWHWSPNYGWAMNMPIRGYMEAMITYVLACASPTFPIPPSCYRNGWAGLSGYANGNTYYGIRQWVGPALGGPLFFTHYSHLGFDPRFKRDLFCNYYDNSRNITLIHRAYSIDNPHDYAGYNRWAWGLTASTTPPPTNYWAHSPTSDLGTIAPTAAVSALPFTPTESLETIRYYYDRFGAALFGTYGFRDAFNETQSWFSNTYLAIDQGPIVVMIENYRTQRPWAWFMANPEIRPALRAMGWTFDGDFNGDGYLDGADFAAMASCVTGPQVTTGCVAADLDGDADADLTDLARFQQAYSLP